MSKRPRGLGAGFASLLGDKMNLSPDSDHDDELIHLSLSALIAGRFQPRTQWDDAALTELANSIQAQGVVQPIVVRPLAGGLYEIITGERRWRASKLAGLTSIPAVVRHLDDQSALAIALIENIQREDLSAIEEARAIRNLTDTFELTHEQVAQLLGRSREAVSNLLRLLKLAPSVQDSVLDGQLSAGHARALIALEEPQQQQLAQQTISHQWSVRELETAVRQLQQPEQPTAIDSVIKPTLNSEFEHWCDALSDKFGVKVRLSVNAKGKGKIEIPFVSAAELKLLVDKLQ